MREEISMWKTTKLGEVCEIIAGQSPESTYYNKEGNGKPFFQGKADFNDDFPTVRYYTTKVTKTAKVNDILLSVRAPVGPTNICNTEACIGRGLAAIRTKDNLDYKYVYFYFKSIEDKLSQSGNGSTFSAITTGDVKNLLIPLPSLPTQKRIAEILDKADALRKKDQHLLKHYDDLAQSLFIDMFGDPVRNEKGWNLISGRKLFSILGGAAFKSSDYQDNGIPLIRIGTVNKGYFDKSQQVFLPHDFVNKFKRYLVYPKDLLMTLTGTVGKDDYGNPFTLGYEAQQYFLNQRVAKISVLENYELIFIEFYFKQKSVKRQLTGVSRGVRQANISNEDFYKLSVISPPRNLQLNFAECIYNIEQQKQKVKDQMQESENLFQALLQQSFNGGSN